MGCLLIAKNLNQRAKALITLRIAMIEKVLKGLAM